MINKTDQRLIIELQKDGRASYAELAAKLGITASTVAKRVETLIKSKTIDIRALQNPFKLGLMANALIAIKTDPTKIDDICNQLVDNFNVFQNRISGSSSPLTLWRQPYEFGMPPLFHPAIRASSWL
jgi:DNA-binding Lrp family transcriptional regulator